MHDLNVLIEKCKKNDEAAQDAIYHIFARKIMGVCRKYTYSSFEADDVFQETFVKIFTRIETFDQNKGEFEPWIKKIAVNESLIYLKKKMKEKHVSIEDVNEGVLETNENDDKVLLNDLLKPEDCLKLIDQLPEGKKVIFNLYVVEGYSHQEIADILDISVGTSKSQLNKAKILLRQLINDTLVKS